MVALVVVVLLYGPVLGYGLVNHDDGWLVRDNHLLEALSADTLAKIFFDTSASTRFVLGAEYLPVRDLTVLFDHQVWGDWYGGHHLTSLLIYLALLVVWFRALVEIGVERALVGLAILLWAVMPAHAESVAWVSERKGLLGVLFAGVAVLGYAKFRAGRSTGWVVVAALAAICAVWSKAPSAFAVAVIAPLEVICADRRVSWRRSLAGIAVIAVAGLVAFVPVVMTATNLSVVGTQDAAPAGYATMAAGLHGFYLQLGGMAQRNAISYPIGTLGPSTVDVVIGLVGAIVAIAAAVVPRRGWWQPPAAVRLGAWIWLLGYFPASRLVLPLRAVLVSDRYVLFASLGLALAIAAGLVAIGQARARNALVATLVIAASVRTLDARTNWRDDVTLWGRATVSNPADGGAWNAYVEALLASRQHEAAFKAMRQALRHTRAPSLLLREALMVLDYGERARGVELMEEAARGGESKAMANLALLLVQDGRGEDALSWARKAVATAPLYARGHRTHGEVALAMKRPVEALLALQRAYALSPVDAGTRYTLALALIELHQPDTARPHLEACLDDPKLGAKCRQALGQLRR